MRKPAMNSYVEPDEQSAQKLTTSTGLGGACKGKGGRQEASSKGPCGTFSFSHIIWFHF
jgi:hypothetical protein